VIVAFTGEKKGKIQSGREIRKKNEKNPGGSENVRGHLG